MPYNSPSGRVRKETLDRLTELERIVQDNTGKTNVVISELEPLEYNDDTFWYKDVGSSPSVEAGDGLVVANAEVADDAPTETERNGLWFDIEEPDETDET